MPDTEFIYIVINEQMCGVFVDTNKPIGNYVDKILNLMDLPPQSRSLRFTLDGTVLDQSVIWKNVDGIVSVRVDETSE
jgi:hypothetical protein